MTGELKYRILRRRLDDGKMETIAAFKYELERDYAFDELELAGRRIEKEDA